MFFYSNTQECRGIVNDKSFILSFLRNKYNSVRLYSFDINLNSEIVSFFVKNYKIDGCYAIVLNDKKITGNVTTSHDLEKYLKR